MLYAYTSAVGNNGSAFGGINANTPYFNTTMGIAMLFGRFLMMIPLLAAAGSLAQKKLVPVSAGTFPTHGPLFVGLLVGVVVIVGALTFFPALSLGPIVEHFLMHARQTLELDSHGDLTSPEVTPARQASPAPVDAVSLMPKKGSRSRPLFDPPIVKRAITDSLLKLNPRTMMKNPVMFVVEVGAVMTTVLAVRDFAGGPASPASPFRSRCGCGSPCCSPTSPKPWRKAAARRRPTRCARPRPKPRRAGW